MFCASLFPTQKNRISIDLDRCRFTVLLAIPTAVALLQCTGVRGCMCPKSSSVCRKIFPSWQLWKRAPSSASAADATTKRKVVVLTQNTPFNWISSSFLGIHPMKKCPHDLTRVGFGKVRCIRVDVHYHVGRTEADFCILVSH